MTSTNLQNQLIQLYHDAPKRLLLAAVSGSRVYGLHHADSDYDVRGIYLAPVRESLGLNFDPPALEPKIGSDSDIVLFELSKFCQSLAAKNGQFLEYLFSPDVFVECSEINQMRTIVQENLVKHFAHYFKGFAKGQLHQAKAELESGGNPWKCLVQGMRCLLSGIQFLETEQIQLNIESLLQTSGLECSEQDLINTLIKLKRKTMTPESAPTTLFDGVEGLYSRLFERFDLAFANTKLPEKSALALCLNEFYVEVRLAQAAALT